MQVRFPIKSRRSRNVTAKYRFDLLLCAKNDAKSRLFQSIKRIDQLKRTLNADLTPEHIELIGNVTSKFETKSFQYWKDHLREKFVKLQRIERKHTPNNDCLLYTSPSPRDRG